MLVKIRSESNEGYRTDGCIFQGEDVGLTADAVEVSLEM